MAETRHLEPGEWEFWDTWMRAQRLLTAELERGLQRECGISKAEFSVLVTLWRAGGRTLRVGEMAAALDWDKSRVAHQLTRMEKRGFVERSAYGADGRRAGVALTADGRRAAEEAIAVHAGNIRRHALDPLTAEQAAVFRAWSEQVIDRLDGVEPVAGGTADDAGS